MNTSHSSQSFKRKRSKKKKKMKKSREDRISALPDAIIHHIFSFMDMRDVVGTSILSNRWKTLWLSTSILNFSLNLFPDCIEDWDFDYGFCDFCPKGRKTFKDFVDRVLVLRGNYKIDKFDVCCSYAEVETPRVYTWILAALGRNVRHLLLEVGLSYQIWELPHKLFTSNITVLKLWFYGTVGSQVRLPSLICNAPRIKILQLRAVAFPDGNANGELNLSCPVLESLSITRCDLSNIEIFTISTPQLGSLELVNIYTNRNQYCRVKTCTPNLKMIKVKIDSSFRGISFLDNSTVDYCLESLTSLVSAEVGFHSDFIGEKTLSECLIKVLSGLHNVRSLKLADVSLQLLNDFPESLEQLSDVFCNLKSVVLELGSLSVHSVLNFLERFPCIETLVWDRHLEKVKGGCQYFSEVEKSVDLPFLRIFSCLKTFEIRNFQGLEIELEFLEFLLQKAIVLEDMIINTSGPCLLAEMLQTLPRASLSASIVFTQSCRATTSEDFDP